MMNVQVRASKLLLFYFLNLFVMLFMLLEFA